MRRLLRLGSFPLFGPLFVPFWGLLAGLGCGLLGNTPLSITYDFDPQAFSHDFGNQMGTLMSVDCSKNPAVCSMVQAPGATASCDPASKKCVLDTVVRLPQTVNLSTQKGFPSEVTNSSIISDVKVNAVRYWASANTLTFDTPPLDLYAGPQTAKTETDAGVAKLGTMPTIPAGKPTSCRGNTTPGTRDSACNMDLTDAGKNTLGMLAKDYKTPFNVIVVAHLHTAPGQPIPAGKLDLWLQPQLAFVIPLK